MHIPRGVQRSTSVGEQMENAGCCRETKRKTPWMDRDKQLCKYNWAQACSPAKTVWGWWVYLETQDKTDLLLGRCRDALGVATYGCEEQGHQL